MFEGGRLVCQGRDRCREIPRAMEMTTSESDQFSSLAWNLWSWSKLSNVCIGYSLLWATNERGWMRCYWVIYLWTTIDNPVVMAQSAVIVERRKPRSKHAKDWEYGGILHCLILPVAELVAGWRRNSKWNVDENTADLNKQWRIPPNNQTFACFERGWRRSSITALWAMTTDSSFVLHNYITQ